MRISLCNRGAPRARKSGLVLTGHNFRFCQRHSMSQRVFVKVVGFSDAERHALNTLFRLSEERDTTYSSWSRGAPEAPKLALVDAFSHEAMVEANSRQAGEIKLIWIGVDPPKHAWRSFARPLHWTPVVQAMDGLFGPPAELDFDVSMPAVDFDLESGFGAMEPIRRGLIANKDRDERLYLRAKLVLAGVTQADEAGTAVEALALLRFHDYAYEIVDLDMPDMDAKQFLRKVTARQSESARLIVTTTDAAWIKRLRARRAGAIACLGKPLDPYKLHRLLRKK
jgi:CheY-like chemotaxis protein